MTRGDHPVQWRPPPPPSGPSPDACQRCGKADRVLGALLCGPCITGRLTSMRQLEHAARQVAELLGIEQDIEPGPVAEGYRADMAAAAAVLARVLGDVEPARYCRCGVRAPCADHERAA